MRSLISLSVAALLALGALSGDAAGQTRKKSKAKRHRASATSAVPATSSAAGQPATAPATPTASIVPTAPTTLAAPVSSVEPQGDGVRRITPAEARAAIEKGLAIIIDVRGEDSYNAGHVRGARWLSVNDIGAHAGELPRDKMIITYCS